MENYWETLSQALLTFDSVAEAVMCPRNTCWFKTVTVQYKAKVQEVPRV